MKIKQNIFDFDAVTEESKFSLTPPKEYMVLFWKVEVSHFVDVDDALDLWPSQNKEYKTYSERLGLLDVNTHSSHFKSLMKQLNEKYGKLKFCKEHFRIRPGETIISAGISTYRETFREFILEKS